MRLLTEASEYKLAKHVDIDLFDMPPEAALQIARPAKIVNVMRTKGIP